MYIDENGCVRVLFTQTTTRKRKHRLKYSIQSNSFDRKNERERDD